MPSSRFSTRLVARCLLVAGTAAVLDAHAAVAAISAGNNHSLGLRTDGTVRAWGWDASGQLGIGRLSQSYLPIAVNGLGDIRQVSAAGQVLALRGDGTVWAWGNNGRGHLGDGTKTNRSTPLPVPGLGGVVAVAAGSAQSVALKGDGTV